MSNFWDLSDGSTAQSTQTFELSGGNLEPIPENTRLRAYIEEATLASTEYEPTPYVNLKWRTVKPDAYKNRVLFQKLHIDSPDPKKSDNAKRMLAAIDANCGGNLVTGRLAPDEANMSTHFLNKFMDITVAVWKFDKDDNGNPLPSDQVRQGNWIRQVSAAGAGAAQQPSAQPVQQPAPVAQQQRTTPQHPASAPLDEDIPF